MTWWATRDLSAILLMVIALLLWKRFARVVLSSQRSSRSWPRIAPRRSSNVSALEAESTQFVATCPSCQLTEPILLATARFEDTPWRLVWTCRECRKPAKIAVADGYVDMFLDLDKAGGTAISLREYKQFLAWKATSRLDEQIRQAFRP